MKVKMLLVAAALGCLAMASAADAQVRYSQPAYRGTARAVHYSRASSMGGGDCGCAAEEAAPCSSCGGCVGGCGRCRRGLLSLVAGGVGRLADGVGATLDCLFPGGACCEPACGESPCCARRPSCGTRACMRRGYGCGGCEAGCAGCGADSWDEGGVIEEHEASPKTPSPAPTPVPEADSPKATRHYQPLPPTRTSYSKPRSAANSRPTVKSTKSPTVRASAEEDVAPAAKAPRTLMVRPVEAKRLTPPAEEVEESVEPLPIVPARTSSRVPANPLRTR